MASEETTVEADGTIELPASLRHRLDIEPGDTLRWETAGDGTLSVTVVGQRYGAFEDDEMMAPMGDAPETHDLAGHEDDPTFAGDE